jgi:hypothetical protein
MLFKLSEKQGVDSPSIILIVDPEVYFQVMVV